MTEQQQAEYEVRVAGETLEARMIALEIALGRYRQAIARREKIRERAPSN
ncbi:hypothetical protein [Amaricoccus solimangrovi]|nr:hypothetical protein [Amaricoccus solimangrovi]